MISILNVTDENDLMIINKSGITIRMAVEELRVMGRATQGVRLISLRGKDAIAAVCKVPKSDEEEELNDEMGDDIQDGAPASDDDAPATDNPDRWRRLRRLGTTFDTGSL